MTFNVGVLFAVVGGIHVGEFLVGRYSAGGSWRMGRGIMSWGVSKLNPWYCSHSDLGIYFPDAATSSISLRESKM